MSFSANYVSVNNPNIPILSTSQAANIPLGKFIPTPNGDVQCFDGVVSGMKVYDMYLSNFSLRLFEGRIVENAVFSNMQGEGLDLLGSCLFIKGNVSSRLPGEPDGPWSTNYTHNLKFDPNNEYIHSCKANSDLHFIHLSYTPEYLNQFLPEERWADTLKNQLAKKERMIGARFADITLAQEQALKNILNCPMDGKLGNMMIETSLIQVILIQMYSLFRNEEGFKEPAANRRDIELIKQLKEHLTRTFLQEHCLQSLAKEFGTNTNKLMSLFKKVFGKSIFEFIGELRMDHAMELLRDRGLLVTEVARILGYKNPNHFSSAFKKRFGVNPSDLK
jgi:AraC-like DNA-binding protein